MSTHLEWRIPVLTLLFVTMASVVQARQIASSFDELRFLVKIGDTVTVTDSLGGRTKGRIAHLSPSSLALSTRHGKRGVNESEVTRITRRRHGNLGLGAIAGLVAGAALGTALATGGECDECGPAAVLWAAGLLGGVGSGVGVAVSAMTSRNRVVFDRPRASTVRVTVSPILARDRQVIGLLIRF
ncbi:MAG: hypothetical protein ACRD2A_05915 [Vicinamibacterales bacterium]